MCQQNNDLNIYQLNQDKNDALQAQTLFYKNINQNSAIMLTFGLKNQTTSHFKQNEKLKIKRQNMQQDFQDYEEQSNGEQQYVAEVEEVVEDQEEEGSESEQIVHQNMQQVEQIASEKESVDDEESEYVSARKDQDDAEQNEGIQVQQVENVEEQAQYLDETNETIISDELLQKLQALDTGGQKESMIKSMIQRQLRKEFEHLIQSKRPKPTKKRPRQFIEEEAVAQNEQGKFKMESHRKIETKTYGKLFNTTRYSRQILCKSSHVGFQFGGRGHQIPLMGLGQSQGQNNMTPIKYTCYDCNYNSDRKEDLVNHAEQQHGKEMLRCKLCGKQFLEKQKRTAHMLKAVGKVCSLICDVVGCGAVFEKEHDLVMHELEMHEWGRTKEQEFERFDKQAKNHPNKKVPFKQIEKLLMKRFRGLPQKEIDDTFLHKDNCYLLLKQNKLIQAVSIYEELASEEGPYGILKYFLTKEDGAGHGTLLLEKQIWLLETMRNIDVYLQADPKLIQFWFKKGFFHYKHADLTPERQMAIKMYPGMVLMHRRLKGYYEDRFDKVRAPDAEIKSTEAKIQARKIEMIEPTREFAQLELDLLDQQGKIINKMQQYGFQSDMAGTPERITEMIRKIMMVSYGRYYDITPHCPLWCSKNKFDARLRLWAWTNFCNFNWSESKFYLKRVQVELIRNKKSSVCVVSCQSEKNPYFKEFVEACSIQFEVTAQVFGNYLVKLPYSILVLFFLTPEWIELLVKNQDHTYGSDRKMPEEIRECKSYIRDRNDEICREKAKGKTIDEIQRFFNIRRQEITNTVRDNKTTVDFYQNQVSVYPEGAGESKKKQRVDDLKWNKIS